MRYRIGELADFFGMTKEGVRYLERQGIITSVRDESNGYRYFPREEITRLKQIRSYQSIGFGLEEAHSMVCLTPREELLDRLDEKIAELESKAADIARISNMLKGQREAAEKTLSGAGAYEVTMRPELIFFERVSDEASGETPQEKRSIAHARNVEKTWIQAMPPVTLGACHYDHTGKGVRRIGSIALAQDVRTLGLPVLPQMVRLESCLCVRGIAESPWEKKPDIAPLLCFAQERGYALCGDVYAIAKMTYEFEDAVWGIHEFFLPVREKDIKNA